MKCLIVLKDGVDNEAFAEKVRLVGLTPTLLSAMSNILIVEGCKAADFPIKEGVLSIEDDEVVKGAESLSIDLSTASDSWAIVRHTSRDLPWDRLGMRYPVEAEFECHRTGQGVSIYLVDSGIRLTHEEFGGRAVSLDGFTPLHTHGTMTASCAAGASLGLARDAEIYMAAGLRNANNTGSTSDIVAAINACLSHFIGDGRKRPGVLSMSFMNTLNVFNSAVTNCTEAGMVAVAAAGNDRLHLASTDAYPAENSDVITVGGINICDEPYDLFGFGTNYGMEIDILGAAQRVSVASFGSDTERVVSSGTSFAAPHVAGVIACMLQNYERPTTAAQGRQVLLALQREATFGRYIPTYPFKPMRDGIAYLDPRDVITSIEGLTLAT